MNTENTITTNIPEHQNNSLCSPHQISGKYKVADDIFAEIKPLFDRLIDKLCADNHYSDVSILVEKSTGKNYRVSKSGTIIKDNTFAATGAVIRLMSPAGLYEYSFNDFSEAFINSIPDIIRHALSDNFHPASPNSTIDPAFNTSRLCFNKATEYEINPEDLSDEDITSTLSDIHKSAMNYNDKIIDCICIFQYLTIHKMFLSKEKDLQQHIMWSTGVAQPLASTGDKTHYYHKAFSTLGGAELLKEMTTDISEACQCAVELLDSVVPPCGEYEVICMPDVTGLIAHEAFGHGVEMDMFVKDRALAKNYIGQQIASPLVTMHDNASTCQQAATYFFDDEGTLSHDTVIIKDGILISGINDILSAGSLKVSPTGNGRRESYERKAYTRMTNTYFEAGNSSLEEMIASIDYGILLDNGASGMEDPKNWGIQCMVNIGREIKNGKLTGKIFSPLCLSGYVPDLLKSFSMISTDLKLSGSGYCGKGYKEWVKVSDGGAAIKAKVTIS